MVTRHTTPTWDRRTKGNCIYNNWTCFHTFSMWPGPNALTVLVGIFLSGRNLCTEITYCTQRKSLVIMLTCNKTCFFKNLQLIQLLSHSALKNDLRKLCDISKLSKWFFAKSRTVSLKICCQPVLSYKNMHWKWAMGYWLQAAKALPKKPVHFILSQWKKPL